jgi:hypothetical protein
MCFQADGGIERNVHLLSFFKDKLRFISHVPISGQSFTVQPDRVLGVLHCEDSEYQLQDVCLSKC